MLLKGLRYLAIILGVSIVACGVIPFMLMPSIDAGVALPVVSVPGEILWKNVGPLDFTITNTIIGTLLADIVLLLFAFGATYKMSFDKPGRLQGLFEVLTDALYGLAKSTAGKNAKKIFPLMATIFLFLLIANWWELVPGVDSIGLMHCADDGFSGYEAKDFVVGKSLKVDRPLQQGIAATHENYELCHEAEAGHAEHDPVHELTQAALLEATALVLHLDEPLTMKDDIENATSIADYVIATNDEAADADEAEGEDAEAEAEPAMSDGAALGAIQAAAIPLLEEKLAHAIEEGEFDEEELAAVEEEMEHLKDVVNGVLYEPYYRDDIHIVTPFVRAAATDLNLTLGLGLFAFIAIQVFGVQALGISYFAKFINTPALGNMDKNPMGAMDFVVGLLEIISELAKIVSFGFRLFGNIFAGQVLLFVMTFLVATLLPAIFYGLELFVGLIQAFVFAMLLLVFSTMAMAGHGHDEEHH